MAHMKLKNIFIISVFVATTVFAMDPENAENEDKICYEDGKCFSLKKVHEGQFSIVTSSEGEKAIFERGSLVICYVPSCEQLMRAYKDMTFGKNKI